MYFRLYWTLSYFLQRMVSEQVLSINFFNWSWQEVSLREWEDESPPSWCFINWNLSFKTVKSEKAYWIDGDAELMQIHKKSENGAPWGIFLKTHKCFDFEPPSQDRESRMLDRATPTGLNLFGSHMIWYSLQINVRNLLIHRLISVEPTRSRLLPLATNPIRLFKFYLAVAISIYEKDYSA